MMLYVIILYFSYINVSQGFKLKYNVLHKTEPFQHGGTNLPQLNYSTYHFQVPVDHFSYTKNEMFKLRYLVADQFWNHAGGPIFFYTGNEGDITWFCKNTGFMWEIAPEFNALLVFAEHRYYGESLPYGNDSFKDLQHLGYLSSEQALADFASLILYIHQFWHGAETSPVIAFGGSYGGMLAAWLRMKYPHVVVGSLAASAPIWNFGELSACNSFYQITTKAFARKSKACAENIKRSWDVITSLGIKESGRQFLSEMFRLCKSLSSASDVALVKEWLVEIYGNLAMVDYPYPASFLEPLPAWPIKEVCKPLNIPTLSDKDVIKGLAHIINIYFNYTGRATCFNTSQQTEPGFDLDRWGFQACTEMVMPQCADGVTDMFEKFSWNISQFAAKCRSQWGDIPVRPHWAEIVYGGKNISSASNIIFSNGQLDPWSGGGVRESLSKSLISIIIEDAAHHLDLRYSNPSDPPSVILARKKEKEIIHQWLLEARSNRNKIDIVSIPKENANRMDVEE